MRNDFEIIAHALEDLDGTSIMNNPQLATHIKEFALFDGGQEPLAADVIWILSSKGSDDWSILQSLGNFVVLDTPERTAAQMLGPESNAIVLPHRTSLEDAMRAVHGAVAGIATIHAHATQLLGAALSNPGLDAIMDLAAEMLGNPTCLLVMDGSAIAASRQVETGDELWDRLVYQRVRTTEDSDLVQILDYAQSLFYGNITRPTFFVAKPWKRRLMAGVWVGSSCNHLFVLLENARTIRPEDVVVTECICELLSHALEEETPMAESPTALFEALLRGERVEADRALRVAREAGLETSAPARLAVLVEEDQPLSYLRTMQLLDRVKRFLPRANVFAHEMRCVLSIPCADDAKALAQLSQLHASMGVPGLVMGVSHPLSSFEDVRRAYRQCEAALELGSGTVRRYEEVVSTDLIRQLPAQLVPEEYCPKVAYDIIAYDRTNETEYAWTILRWLRHFKDHRKVAEELHIHVNTVRYRLERASQLFGVDMDDDALVDCLRTSFQVMMAAGTRLPRV